MKYKFPAKPVKCKQKNLTLSMKSDKLIKHDSLLVAEKISQGLQIFNSCFGKDNTEKCSPFKGFSNHEIEKAGQLLKKRMYEINSENKCTSKTNPFRCTNVKKLSSSTKLPNNTFLLSKTDQTRSSDFKSGNGILRKARLNIASNYQVQDGLFSPSESWLQKSGEEVSKSNPTESKAKKEENVSLSTLLKSQKNISSKKVNSKDVNTKSHLTDSRLTQDVENVKGPRIKHVCRSASVVLKLPTATIDDHHDHLSGCTSHETLEVDATSKKSSTTSKEFDDFESSEPGDTSGKEDLLEEQRYQLFSKSSECETSLQPSEKSITRKLQDYWKDPDLLTKEQQTISIDFWQNYDPDEVCETGFALVGSQPAFPIAICFLCGSAGYDQCQLIHCLICCEPYHEFCLQSILGTSSTVASVKDWLCPSCVRCEVCSQYGIGLGQISCRQCLTSYHTECMSDETHHQMFHCVKCKRWIHTKCNTLLRKGKDISPNYSESYICQYCCCEVDAAPIEHEKEIIVNSLNILNSLKSNKKLFELLQWNKNPSTVCELRKIRKKKFGSIVKSKSLSGSEPDLTLCQDLTLPHGSDTDMTLSDLIIEVLDDINVKSNKFPSKRGVSLDSSNELEFKENNSLCNNQYKSKRGLELKFPPTSFDSFKTSNNLISIKEKIDNYKYRSFLDLHNDILNVLYSIDCMDLLELYSDIVQEILSWLDNNIQSETDLLMKQDLFNETNLIFDAIKERNKMKQNNVVNKTHWSPNQKCKNQRNNEVSKYIQNSINEDDARHCVLCRKLGEGIDSLEGRLLYCGQNEWVHCNCALWSSEVFEEVDGSLQNIHSAIKRSKFIQCIYCSKRGATVGCCSKNCFNTYHFVCAKKSKCHFLESKMIYCNVHEQEVEKTSCKLEENLFVNRPIYVEQIFKRKKYLPVDSIKLMIGALRIHSFGKISLDMCDNNDDLTVPEDFHCSRLFWSTREPLKMVEYDIKTKNEYFQVESEDLGINVTIPHGTDDTVKEVLSVIVDQICTKEDTDDNQLLTPEVKDAIFKDLHHEFIDGLFMNDFLLRYDDILNEPVEDNATVLHVKIHEDNRREKEWTKKLIHPSMEILQVDGMNDSEEEDDISEETMTCERYPTTFRTKIDKYNKREKETTNLLIHPSLKILQVDGINDSGVEEDDDISEEPLTCERYPITLTKIHNYNDQEKERTMRQIHPSMKILQVDGMNDSDEEDDYISEGPLTGERFPRTSTEVHNYNEQKKERTIGQIHPSMKILQVDGMNDSDEEDDSISEEPLTGERFPRTSTEVHNYNEQEKERTMRQIHPCMKILQVDGMNDSDEEDLETSEKPVTCVRCHRTYRTTCSYENHLSDCTVVEYLLSSDSEHEEESENVNCPLSFQNVEQNVMNSQVIDKIAYQSTPLISDVSSTNNLPFVFNSVILPESQTHVQPISYGTSNLQTVTVGEQSYMEAYDNNQIIIGNQFLHEQVIDSNQTYVVKNDTDNTYYNVDLNINGKISHSTPTLMLQPQMSQLSYIQSPQTQYITIAPPTYTMQPTVVMQPNIMPQYISYQPTYSVVNSPQTYIVVNNVPSVSSVVQPQIILHNESKVATKQLTYQKTQTKQYIKKTSYINDVNGVKVVKSTTQKTLIKTEKASAPIGFNGDLLSNKSPLKRVETKASSQHIKKTTSSTHKFQHNPSTIIDYPRKNLAKNNSAHTQDKPTCIRVDSALQNRLLYSKSPRKNFIQYKKLKILPKSAKRLNTLASAFTNEKSINSNKLNLSNFSSCDQRLVKSACKLIAVDLESKPNSREPEPKKGDNFFIQLADDPFTMSLSRNLKKKRQRKQNHSFPSTKKTKPDDFTHDVLEKECLGCSSKGVLLPVIENISNNERNHNATKSFELSVEKEYLGHLNQGILLPENISSNDTIHSSTKSPDLSLVEECLGCSNKGVLLPVTENISNNDRSHNATKALELSAEKKCLGHSNKVILLPENISNNDITHNATKSPDLSLVEECLGCSNKGVLLPVTENISNNDRRYSTTKSHYLPIEEEYLGHSNKGILIPAIENISINDGIDNAMKSPNLSLEEECLGYSNKGILLPVIQINDGIDNAMKSPNLSLEEECLGYSNKGILLPVIQSISPSTGWSTYPALFNVIPDRNENKSVGNLPSPSDTIFNEKINVYCVPDNNDDQFIATTDSCKSKNSIKTFKVYSNKTDKERFVAQKKLAPDSYNVSHNFNPPRKVYSNQNQSKEVLCDNRSTNGEQFLQYKAEKNIKERHFNCLSYLAEFEQEIRDDLENYNETDPYVIANETEKLPISQLDEFQIQSRNESRLETNPTILISNESLLKTPTDVRKQVEKKCEERKKREPDVNIEEKENIISNRQEVLSNIPSTSKSITQRMVFEMKSSDGAFLCQSPCYDELWEKCFVAVQASRVEKHLPPLPTITAKKLKDLGRENKTLKHLLGQISNCYFVNNDSVQSTEENITTRSDIESAKEKILDIAEEDFGCARTKVFNYKKKKYDMFAWMCSIHRKPPRHLHSTPDKDDFYSSRRSTANLSLTSRYHNLRSVAKKNLTVYRSEIHGRGLFSLCDIEAGEMVIEYTGEVIRVNLCDKREKEYLAKNMGCYFFRIDDSFIIDATMKGNAARFINHSCEPNCKSKVLDILGKSHIVIVSLRKIYKGDELTYDYKFSLEDNKIACHCSSSRCRKFLN